MMMVCLSGAMVDDDMIAQELDDLTRLLSSGAVLDYRSYARCLYCILYIWYALH